MGTAQSTTTILSRSGGSGDCRVLIVDDCRLRRDLLADFLSTANCEVSVAWDKESLAAQFNRSDYDIILANMASRDASILVRQGIDRSLTANVIAYGLAEDDENAILSSVEAGVAGYHLRSESVDELLAFIKKVLDGDSACSQKFSTIVLRQLSAASAQRPNGGGGLTSREEEILEMLAMGLSNREIATKLCIAIHTVKNHVHNLLNKIGARTRAEAAAIYHKHSGQRFATNALVGEDR